MHEVAGILDADDPRVIDDVAGVLEEFGTDTAVVLTGDHEGRRPNGRNVVDRRRVEPKEVTGQRRELRTDGVPVILECVIGGIARPERLFHRLDPFVGIVPAGASEGPEELDEREVPPAEDALGNVNVE